MKILEVNYSDLVGRRFNGYDLHLGLIGRGMEAQQAVIEKKSQKDTVRQLKSEAILQQQMIYFEEQKSISHLLYPYGKQLEQTDLYRNADIVHYHILHRMISMLDYARLMNGKRSVWTIHDPWIVTGICRYPLECGKWESRCENCEQYNAQIFKMSLDNSAFMWQLKKDIFSQINPDIIVASEFMRRYIQKSPLTKHFDKIHMIPFGIDTSKYDLNRRQKSKMKFNIPLDSFVIGFRAEDDEIKGCKYLYEALQNIGSDKDIVLVCVGGGQVPEKIAESFRIVPLGWTNDENVLLDFFGMTDLFVMPSLAETFGLMAIEAMAAGCAVLCFEDTVVEEITEAPRCGFTVAYKSSEKIAEQIIKLKDKRDLVKRRGILGNELVKQKYRFEDYVDRHIDLYESILQR